MNKYKLWRAKRGYTQGKMCELLNVSLNTLWRLEKNLPLADKMIVYIDATIEKLEKMEEK